MVALIPTLGSGFGKWRSLWNCSGKSVRRNKVHRTKVTCKRHRLSAADLSGCLSGNQCSNCYSMAQERRRLEVVLGAGRWAQAAREGLTTATLCGSRKETRLPSPENGHKNLEGEEKKKHNKQGKHFTRTHHWKNRKRFLFHAEK